MIHCFTNFLIKNLLLFTKEQELILRVNRYHKNYVNQLTEHLKDVKYTHPLRTTFGVHI